MRRLISCGFDHTGAQKRCWCGRNFEGLYAIVAVGRRFQLVRRLISCGFDHTGAQKMVLVWSKLREIACNFGCRAAVSVGAPPD